MVTFGWWLNSYLGSTILFAFLEANVVFDQEMNKLCLVVL
jgi:hypothetical protein